MISRRQLPELRAFTRAESTLPMRIAPEYASLVVPNGNGSRPVHQWFKYKEAFSADLLDYVLDHVLVASPLPRNIRLLDPFCGVGTALLSAQLLENRPYRIDSIGIECNPFAAFVARTKVAWPRIDPRRLRCLASQVLTSPDGILSNMPALSSISSGRCISRYMARQIVAMRGRIERLPESAERDACLLGLAACIEPASKIRRDGRALRIVDKPRVILAELLAARWEAMAQDVEAVRAARRSAAGVEIRRGDGRQPSTAGIEDCSVDLIFTSPPYPNNIDYNEIYKLELWFLGHVASCEDFLNMRRQTFRSHPTCSPAEEEPEYQRGFSELLAEGPLADLLGMIARRANVLDLECSRGRTKVLLGYAYDTWRTLQAHHRALRAGGCAVYIVGNSLHGGPASRPYLIPTDLIFSCLARHAGFSVENVIIARSLSRRLVGNHFLRDSLVVVRKP